MSKKILTSLHKENIRKGMIKYWEKNRKEILNKNGYITISIGNVKYYKHRLIMEEHLGRKLKKNEVVHHINGIKTDNRIENLQVVNSKEHTRLHAKEKNFGKNRIGIEPINKLSKEKQEKIKQLRKQEFYIKDICKMVGVSYPTAIKYIKENR